MKPAAFLRAWLPVALWAAAVWTIGGLSTVPSDLPSIPHLDKAAHFGMYGVLGLLVGRATRDGSRITGVIMLMLAVGLGAADERRQGTLPGRSMDVKDWVADAAGCITGFIIAGRGSDRKRNTVNGSN